MTYIPGSGGGVGSIATSSDVALSNVSQGEVLSYDNTTAKWTNSPSTGGNPALDAAMVVAYHNGTAWPARPVWDGPVCWVGPLSSDPSGFIENDLKLEYS